MLKFGKIIYEEIFKSPFEKNTEREALIVLDKIREAHDASYGWEEKAGYAQLLPNCKWIAVRHHVKHELISF